MTILEILEAHQQVPGHYDCQCGWEREAITGYISHRAHVAEVLEKHMQEREAVADRLGRGIHANGREKDQS